MQSDLDSSAVTCAGEARVMTPALQQPGNISVAFPITAPDFHRRVSKRERDQWALTHTHFSLSIFFSL